MAADNSSATAAASFSEPAASEPIFDASGGRGWFALFLAPSPRYVRAVQSFAADLGIDSFAPQRRSVRRVQVRERGRKPRIETRVVATPLLGRYLLVYLPRRNTPFHLFGSDAARHAGCAAFVGTVGHGPIEIPEAIVADLQERERRGEFDATVKRGRRVLTTLPAWCSVGSTVHITAGAFRGFSGVVEEHVGEGRVAVAVGLFGRTTTLEISVLDLTTEVPS